MRNSDFFVLPSLWENLPCVLIEAMACGKPIIATQPPVLQEKIINYNKINIFQTVFQLVAVSIFLLIFKKGVFGAIISHVLTIIFVTSLVVLFTKKYINIYISYNKKIFKDLAKYGVKACLGDLTQFLNYRLDMFMVALFLATASVGYYSIAVGIAEQLWMFPGSIATVLFPRISSIKDIEANNLTPRIARHTFFIILIISLILAVLAKTLIEILFGDAFLPSVTPLIILLPGIIALGGAKILSADLAGRGKPEFGLYAAPCFFIGKYSIKFMANPKVGNFWCSFCLKHSLYYSYFNNKY